MRSVNEEKKYFGRHAFGGTQACCFKFLSNKTFSFCKQIMLFAPCETNISAQVFIPKLWIWHIFLRTLSLLRKIKIYCFCYLVEFDTILSETFLSHPYLKLCPSSLNPVLSNSCMHIIILNFSKSNPHFSGNIKPLFWPPTLCTTQLHYYQYPFKMPFLIDKHQEEIDPSIDIWSILR